MRTPVLVDEGLMADTQRATGIQNEQELMELALRTLMRLAQQTELRQLRGKFVWDGDLDAMRRDP